MSDKYDLESVSLPRLAGFGLSTFVTLLESPLTRGLLLGRLLEDAGINKIRSLQIDDIPTMYPYPEQHPKISAAEAANHPCPLPEKPDTPKPKGFRFSTIRHYAEAYQKGKATPSEVATELIAAINDSTKRNPAMNMFIATNNDDILKQAKASAERWAAGNPLSIFDGVPIAVKDEVDMIPYGTTVGTAFLGKTPATSDSTVVARLRAAGALLIGKANMHEIGINVNGNNPHHGIVRNPYNPKHYPGGSSSGSAATVAAGLCPAAIGADGGGSIRIPAALCGVVGLKATFGRISEHGAFPLDWSVAHIGPIAATADDAALLYALITGPDPLDPNSLYQPPPHLEGFGNLDLSGLKVGIYRPWFQHASPAIVNTCQQLLDKMAAKYGFTIHEIEIPELDSIRIAHAITILSEMLTGMSTHYDEHRHEFAPDTRVNLSLATDFNGRDYVISQRVRTRAIRHFMQALDEVDVIVTPTTGMTAPPVPGDALSNGESDLTTTTELMRFAVAGNLTGLPAISFPAGYDENRLPIGMQVMGRPWAEHTLLRIALAAEQLVERNPPQVHYRLLL